MLDLLNSFFVINDVRVWQQFYSKARKVVAYKKSTYTLLYIKIFDCPSVHFIIVFFLMVIILLICREKRVKLFFLICDYSVFLVCYFFIKEYVQAWVYYTILHYVQFQL